MTVGGPGVVSRLPRLSRHYLPPPRVEEMRRDPPALLVISGLPGFGQTSAATYLLRDLDGIGHRVGWVAADRTDGTPSALWRLLADRISVAGGLPAVPWTPDAGVATVHELTARLRRPVTVAIGGLAWGVAAGVDDQLVDLVRHGEFLHLVITAGLGHPIADLAQVAVDGAVVWPADLLFTADHMARVAEGMGRSFSEADAQVYLAELGGWPALVVGALGQLDSPVIASDLQALGSIRIVVERAMTLLPRWLSHAALTTLTSGSHDAMGDLAAVIGSDEAARVERYVAASGLRGTLDPRPDGRRPALHAVVAAVLAKRDPACVAETSRTLLARARRDGRAADALRHAAAVRDWASAAEIVEQGWPALLGPDRDAVAGMLTQMPDSARLEYPALEAVRGLATSAELRRRAGEALRSRRLLPGSELHSGALAFQTRAVDGSGVERGRVGMAGVETDGAGTDGAGRADAQEAEAQKVDAQGDGVEPAGAGRADDLARVLSRWGEALFLRGDDVSAAYVLALAFECAPMDAVTRREAAGSVAVILACLGHFRDARIWASAASAKAGVDHDLASAVVAHATAFARMEPTDATGSLLDDHGGAPGLGVVLRVGAQMARWRFLQTGPHLVEPLGLARTMSGVLGDGSHRVGAEIAARVVDAHLAGGAVDAAVAELGSWSEAAESEAAESEDVRPAIVNARVALYSGDLDRAFGLSAVDPQLVAEQPYSGMEMLLLRACSAWRLGHAHVAAGALMTAVGVAERLGLYAPFVMVPRKELRAIAADQPYLLRFLDEAPLAGASDAFATPVYRVPMTPAELRVLRKLESISSVQELAQSLYVSRSTVKTHLHRIYRKLGVSGRDEAIAAARRMRLL